MEDSRNELDARSKRLGCDVLRQGLLQRVAGWACARWPVPRRSGAR